MKSYCMVVEIRRDCMCRAIGLVLTHKQCVVETGQMSSAETGQMSAVQTGQMPAAETGQMSFVARTEISVASTHNVEVSEVSTVPMLKSQKSQLPQCSGLRSLNCFSFMLHEVQPVELHQQCLNQLMSQKSQWWQCHNVQVSDRRSSPKASKCPEKGPESSPGHKNLSPCMPRPFSRLWDHSHGQESSKRSTSCLFGVSRWGRVIVDLQPWQRSCCY